MIARLRFLGILWIVVLLLSDQLSKWAVLEHMFRPRLGLGDPMRFVDWIMHAPERLPSISIPQLPFMNFAMAWNEGISFGLLSESGALILIAVSVVISLVFVIWMLKSNTWIEIAALSTIIGGAIGNVIDRIRFGAVADFLDFHAGNWHFPTFNVADTAISLGVALLVINGLFFDKKYG